MRIQRLGLVPRGAVAPRRVVQASACHTSIPMWACVRADTGACVQKVCDVAEGHRTGHLSPHSRVGDSPVASDVFPDISRTPFSNP